MRCELAQVKTGDGVLLQGLVFQSRAKKLAVIYVHGLGGDFYGSPEKVRAFAREFGRRGFGFFAFNTRGNNTLTSVKKLDRTSPKGYRYESAGRCYERFTDCVLDIDAFVGEARRRGYHKVALVGHSTGANKVVHYLSKEPSPAVVRAVLTGPVSDVPSQMKQAGKKYKKMVSLAKEMVSAKKSDALMPQGTPGWPISAQRFLSLSVPGSVEDVFQYHMAAPSYRSMKKVRIPTLAVLGEKDEYATVPPEDMLESYRKANRRIEAAVIEGALHSFNGQEEALARLIGSWLPR